jgi:exodeoxyribonuclease VII large subunit
MENKKEIEATEKVVFSLEEVLQRIKRTIAVNFIDDIWVEAEIAEKQVRNGHYFIRFIANKNANIAAQADAVIWKWTIEQNQSLKKSLHVLALGKMVKVKLHIRFDEIYGLRFSITDVDDTSSVGDAEQERQKTLEALIQQNLIAKNKNNTQLPFHTHRIAVISSAQAAGYQDFVKQLLHNNERLRFQLTLFDTNVQGGYAVQGITAAFEAIGLQASNFDCVAVVRGGGASTDLSIFNHLEICKVVADCHLPVLIGIGHDKDTTLLDLVAFQAFKTPTALAEFFVDQKRHLASKTYNLYRLILDKIEHSLLQKKYEITQLNNKIIFESTEQLNQKKHQLALLKQALKQADFRNVLENGFVLVQQNNQMVKRLDQLDTENNELKLIFADGELTVDFSIKKTSPN